MKLSNKWYDRIKGFIIFLVPAISFAIQQLGTIYDFDTTNMTKVIAVLSSLAGAFILYLSGKYKEYKSLEDDKE